MKFRAHDTFFIRKGWLSKGMKHIEAKPDVFISKENNPMDILGIGANMVKALRYWLQATGISEEPNGGRRTQKFTKLGKKIFENDRYVEELGTLILLHYKIVSNKNEATSWYYFFNIFNQVEFNRDEFVEELNKYIAIEGEPSVALRSLNDDFSCIINTYVSRLRINSRKVTAENNIDCPLGELGFIDIVQKGKNPRYRKSSIHPELVDPWIALSIIVDQAGENKSIHLNDLLNSPSNIGKVLNLDTITLLEVLHNIEKIEQIKIIRTAGLDIIKILDSLDFLQCVDNYYESIRG
jgi:hypothetical protein